MKNIFLLMLLSQSFNVFAAKDAAMYLEAKFPKPSKDLLVYKVKLDKSDEASKHKSFSRNKFYGMKDIKYVSIYRDLKNPTNKNMVWFYFHGEEKELSVKVGPVDLRRFLHKKIDLNASSNQCVKLIQGHFDEYNRRSKVFYQAPNSVKLDSENVFLDMAEKAKENLFLKKNPAPAFVLTNNCRGMGNFEYEWPGLLKGHFFIDPKIINEVVADYDQVEIDSKKYPLTRENVASELRTTKYYANQVDIGGWYGFKNKGVQLYSSMKDPIYQWYDLGDFDSVASKCNISEVENGLVRNDGKKSVSLPVTKLSGKIRHEEFSAETRMKSGSVYMQEALSYTLTACGDKSSKNPPPNFAVPEGEGEGMIDREKFWNNNPCARIPHFFASYEDITKFPIFLSMFDIDGVYTGRSKNEDDLKISAADKALQKEERKRVQYSYAEYIDNYKNADISENNGYLTVKLPNKDHNIIIGNIVVSRLIEEEKKPQYVTSFSDIDLFDTNVVGISALFGINPQPLVGNYNATFDPDVLDTTPAPFALMYDDAGKILNHHLPKYGVELWYARKRGCKLVIDLVSHERIMPLARLEMDYFCAEKK